MSASTDQRERELKFDVPDGWELDDPTELVPRGGSASHELVRLESTYFDTPDHSLLRSGLTLRRRTGDADTGWHLKVPAGDARTEIRLPVDRRAVPDELRDITRGARGDADLAPVATLATERALVRLRSADGTDLLEIAVDAVSATTTRRDERLGGDITELQRWREVEIELLGGDEKLLQRAAGWVRRSGATPALVGSKLARALAGDGGAPDAADGGAPVHRADRLGGLVADYLDQQWDAIVLGDVALRRGQDVIHSTRVGTRRYRSVLRVFGKLLDPARAAALDTELRWYAQALGGVRDLQVMRAHLDDQLAALPPELVLGPVAARIHSALDAELATARAELDSVMRSTRYYALLQELRSWHEALPLLRDPAARRAPDHLRRSTRAVRTRLRRARAMPPGSERDAAMHRCRKAAKRARYTAELLQPQLGTPAAKTVKRMKRLQNELGERQDGVVAAELLHRLGAAAGTTAGENGFTFGVLFEQERQRTRRADEQASGDR